jgi:hypothetical protein
MEFVPPQFLGETAPCRFVPLTDTGESVDYFYRSGTRLAALGRTARQGFN